MTSDSTKISKAGLNSIKSELIGAIDLQRQVRNLIKGNSGDALKIRNEVDKSIDILDNLVNYVNQLIRSRQ